MKTLEVAKNTLKHASGDQIEVVVTQRDTALTRFANSYIHQNVKESNGNVIVRVIKNGRQGVASTNSFEDDALKYAAKKAGELADHSPKDPVDFKLPGKASYKSTEPPDEATMAVMPNERAGAVKLMIDYAKPLGMTLAGAYSNRHLNFAVANSNGVEAESEHADAHLKVTAMTPDSSGAAGRWSPRVNEINPMTIIKEAGERALSSQKPQSIEPGEYEVVLLHYAAAELISFLIWTGFSPRSALEKRSWVANNLEKRVLSDKITMIDDPYDPRGSSLPFDWEGFPKSKLTLIENGVPKNLVFDSYYSSRMGKRNTGHALPASNPWGPFPINSVVSEGSKTVEEMISGVKRGVLISSFWYSNIMNPLTVQFTGMTRDGLFLIEDGKVSCGLKNMRVTDSVLRILSSVLDMEKRAHFHDGLITPAMHCGSIIFSGKTEF